MTLALTALLTFVAGVLVGHMIGSGDRLVREQEIYDLRHRLYLADADPEWPRIRKAPPRHLPPPSGSHVRRRGRLRCRGPRGTA